MKTLLPLALLLCLSCQRSGSESRPEPSASLVSAASPVLPDLKPGDPAPNVSLTLHDGRQVALSSYAGKYVAVYFYPMDDTPGCTTEAKGLRDSWKTLQALDIEVLGVSTQDAASHQAFIAKHELPFPLVVDTTHDVMNAFGVPSRLGTAARQTFLIGPDGKILKIWRDVDPAMNAQHIIDAVVN